KSSRTASAKLLAWERWSSNRILKGLQPTQPDAKGAVPLSGDYSLVEPRTADKPLRMRILDPVHQRGWDHLVALHRGAGCFHTSAWAKVLYQSYGHRPFYLQFSHGRRLAES